jgi:quinol-cytochrome oxidoreductase complex cytochrome b subunit
MNWNALIRTSHRWLAIAFTLAAIANIVALLVRGPSQDATAQWLGFAAVVPLIPMMITGLYMFFLPYVRRRAA